MRIVMMGTGSFAEPAFARLLEGPHAIVGLVTQPDRQVGSTRGSTRQAKRGMKELAAEKSVPVFQPESINTPEGVAWLRECQADLLVVAAYGQILNNDVLATTTHGGINIHASLLPKYRGAAPVAWAIYHGEAESGVSIIRMSIYLDAGAVLAQEALAIGEHETAGELEIRLAELGARMMADVVEQIGTGSAAGFTQDKSLVTKAPKLKKEHGLIDWSRSANAVSCQIRAMQPWPTAYTFLHREGQPALRLMVQKSAAANIVCDAETAPGALISDPQHPKSLLVAAGSDGGQRTVLEVLELQPSGKKRMAAADFLRGYPARPSDRMGPEA